MIAAEWIAAAAGAAMAGGQDARYHVVMERKRVDVGTITLVWGNPAKAKADLRAESEKRFRERPAGERLAAALSMVRSPERKRGG